MDLKNMYGRSKEVIKKYRYAVAVLVIGIGLMLLPELGEKKEVATTVEQEEMAPDVAASLSRILSQIHGAGKVEIYLTLESSERTVYQTDGDSQGGGADTVIVTDEDRAQQGLVQEVLSPQYRGAIILCQGADDPTVRLSIVEAVADATGLTSDRISILKMK
ncbi:MAG: hypothetical protein IJW45_06250 [Oscillospiraceae bacterium]|nr:hypothetical protein [Oscillospiraceae bacterium]